MIKRVCAFALLFLFCAIAFSIHSAIYAQVQIQGPTVVIGGGGSPGGTTGQAQINSSGAFSGVPVTMDTSGNITTTGNVKGLVQDKGGQVYNVLAYGADNTGATCTQAAIQSAITAAAGAPVIAPAGKYRLCAPIYYYTPNAGRISSPGLQLAGAGLLGKTQFVLDPSFAIPATITVGGIVVATQPAVIDIQGTLSAAGYAVFMYGAKISNIEIAPLGCETNPGGGEPSCAHPSTPISGISMTGCWHCGMENVTVNQLSGDGVVEPYASWIGIDPDWWAVVYLTMNHMTLTNNGGWGVNYDSFDGASGDVIENSTITGNYLGGVRDTGWSNRESNNGIALNGCGPTFAGTSGSPTSCTTVPPGPGILVERTPLGGGPINGIIDDRNTFDSNAGGHVRLSEGLNFRIENNFVITHVTGYVYNNTFPGALQVPNRFITLGGSGAGPVNTTIQANHGRSDYQCAGGFPIPSNGCAGYNFGMDPEAVGVSFVVDSSTKVDQQNFRNSNESANFVPYNNGAGAIANYPVMNGGGTSVTSWSLLDGGIGLFAAPTIKVWGGDSAFAGSTVVALTQTSGALTGCSVIQAGGPYNRMPATSVTDNQNNMGSGGAFSITLSGGTSGTPLLGSSGCTVTTAGSGYLHPIGGVAPQCATPPVVSATASIGISYVSVSNGGNYGAWTPGATPPTITATVTDSGSGTGYSVVPVIRAVNTNTNPNTTPTVIWQVSGVRVLARGYNSATMSIAFSSSATVTTAVASVIPGHVLSLPLTVSNGGTCDAGAALGLIFQYPGLASSNSSLDLVMESNTVVSSPPPGPVSQLTINNMTMWNTNGGANTMQVEQGTTINSSTGAALMNIIHDTNGTNTSGLALDATHGSMEIYPYVIGADSPVPLYIFSGTGQQFELGSNNTIQYQIESTGDLIPNGTNTLPNLGSAAHPWKDYFFGADSTHYFHLDTTALTAGGRTLKLVDAATQNPIVPLSSATSGQFIQYIDNTGTQHLAAPGSSTPSWNVSLGMQTTVLATPIAATTYYVGVGASANTTSLSTTTGGWAAIAPEGCTVRSVAYLANVAGTKDTTLNNFTLKIYDITTSSAFADTAATVALNGSSLPAITPLTGLSADAITAGDRIMLQVVTPASYGTQPTNVLFGAQLLCY